MKTMEIEFKNLITDLEFKLLINYFQNYKQNIQKFTNIYLDTTDHYFKNNNCALRLRRYDNYTELTLKKKTKNKLEHLEHTHKINKSDEELILTQSHLPPSLRKQYFHHNRQLEPLTIFGELTTERIEICYKKGTIALDKCFYLNVSDFELEYEVANYEEGKQIFDSLLSTLKIPVRHTKSKIERFIDQYNSKK